MRSDPKQSKRIASFNTPLGPDALVLTRLQVAEGLSEPFEIYVEAVSKSQDLDIGKLLGEKCCVTFETRGGERRYFSGIAVEAQRIGEEEADFAYRVVLRPWLWLLSQRADCRIFHNKKPEEVIREIFNKEDKKDFEVRLSDNYQTMEYCVQYRETDFDFVSRLMEKHGIYYYFKHDADGHKMVLADSKASHDLRKAPAGKSGAGGFASDGSYPFLPRGSTNARYSEHLLDWLKERRLRTGRIELTDYDFKKSTSDLRRSREQGAAPAKRYEIFDYPGGYVERGDGERFAEIRVQAQQALDQRRYSAGDAVSLHPGALFRLSGHPIEAENGEHLVVRAKHSFAAQSYRSGGGDGDEVYRGSYEFLRSDQRFRAPALTPRPIVYGPQTAKVVGERRQQGEEIDVDEHGCILVQFHWDRGSDTTSRRVRVAQTWSGKQWGSQMIPRIGQEVVVEFLEGDPDQPLVVGTVYNDQHKLPYELPANKTMSGVKSNSSKNGGGYNEFRFEDKKGEEFVGLRAEKDLKSVIRNTETREIGEAFSTPSGKFSRKTTLKNGDDVLDVEQGSLLIEAKTKIRLKVGMSTVTIEPNSVTIDSPTVTVTSVTTNVTGDANVVINGGMVKIN